MRLKRSIGILVAISMLGIMALAIFKGAPHPVPVDDSTQIPKSANVSELPADSAGGIGPKSLEKPKEDLSHLLGGNHFRRWLRHGPLEERLEYFRNLPVGSDNGYGGETRDLIKDLYSVSPDDAIQLVVEKKGIGDFWAASMQLGEILGKAGGLDKLSELSTTEGGPVITSGYLEGLATVNPEEAFALSAVFSTTGVDPSGAIVNAAAGARKYQETIAAIHKFNIPEKDRKIKSVYRSWSMSAPLDAANHLILRATPQTREMCLGCVLATWESRDPDGHEKWLESLKDSPAAEVVEKAQRKAWED